MVQPASPPRAPSPQDDGPVDVGHPRGTLAIVVTFGILLGLGWAAMYVWGFLARGAPRP